MLDYGANEPGVFRYLPIEKEIHKLPRSYLANVIYTVKGVHFENWVNDRVKQRNDKIK